MNAFVPIKPIPETSSGYDNFLKFLQGAGAVSNLADTIMYRHIPDPPGRYNEKNILNKPVQLSSVWRNSPEKDALLKAEPYLKNSIISASQYDKYGQTIGEQEGLIQTFGNKNVKGKQDVIPHAEVTIGKGVETKETKKNFEEYERKRIKNLLGHEVNGHAPAMIRPDFQAASNNGGRKFEYDRLTGAFSENKVPVHDQYIRSAREIIAESNQAGVKDFSIRISKHNPDYDLTYGMPEARAAVRPQEQIISFLPQFMQDKSLVDKIAQAGKSFGKLMGVAGLPSQVTDYDNLRKEVNQNGAIGGYAKWLGLNTYDPTKDAI